MYTKFVLEDVMVRDNWKESDLNRRIILKRYVVGPCHHGMARPQVADRGTASDKEGSCE